MENVHMPGPPLQRLLVSLLIGMLLVGVYWWAADAVPRAMLAEAELLSLPR
jgi:hypothetical protein